jgi:hypothetical protein
MAAVPTRITGRSKQAGRRTNIPDEHYHSVLSFPHSGGSDSCRLYATAHQGASQMSICWRGLPPYASSCPRPVGTSAVLLASLPFARESSA